MKNIYRDRYDCSDAKDNFINFKLQSNLSLGSMPNLLAFQDKSKLNIYEEVQKERLVRSIEKSKPNEFVQKEEYFGVNKDVLFDKPFKPQPKKVLKSSHDSCLKSDIFIKNIKYLS